MSLGYLRMVFGYKVLVPVLLIARKVYSVIDHNRDSENLMVNIGGGVFIKRHWKNLDYRSDVSPYNPAYLDYDFDLTSAEPFPFRSGAVKFFYSSHTLEHIPQEFCDHIFKEIYRCLKPSGAVRLTMPDFDKVYDEYGTGKIVSWGHMDRLEDNFCVAIADALIGKLEPAETRAAFEKMSRAEFGDYITGMVPRDVQRSHMNFHCNWWNYDKLHSMLERAGFREICRSEPLASQFPEMRARGSFLGLESFGSLRGVRAFDFNIPEASVFVEAIK